MSARNRCALTAKGYVFTQERITQLRARAPMNLGTFEALWPKFNAWIGERVTLGELAPGEVSFERIFELWQRFRAGRCAIIGCEVLGKHERHADRDGLPLEQKASPA
jgi:hypothetical protein